MCNFTLYMTTVCNFKCQYCYEDYHNHYQLDEKSLIDTLEFVMNYRDKDKVLIDFLGGEPLLKKDLICQAVQYIQDNYPEREVKYYITTNCSLIDDEFIAFMKKNNFFARLSFDGNRETYELNRVAKDGTSCYEKIYENILKVKESGLNYSVRMTVTENTISHMFDNVFFFHSNGLDNICMIMDVYLKLTPELTTTFMQQVEYITDYYIQEFEEGRGFTIDQFDGKMFNMLCDFGNCFAMCDAGIGNFKVFPNGQIYPCGFLTNDDKYVIGNIYDGIDIRKAKIIALSNYDKNTDKCSECRIRDFCHGMKCGYMNFVNTGKINIPSEAECQCERIFYDAMTKIMEYYLKKFNYRIKEKLVPYLDCIQKDQLQLSDYGKKMKQRIINGE